MMKRSIYSNQFSPAENTSSVQTFVNKFETRYDTEANTFCALGYDSAYFLAYAMKRADSMNSSDITKAIASTEYFNGITGQISIDSNHETIKSGVVTEFINGMPSNAVRVQP